MRTLYLVATLGLLVVATESCGSSVSVPEGAETALAAQEREKASDFRLEDMEGTEVALSSFEGKVVLLNFWATWCGPCKIEMPWFVDFQRKYKDQGFSVVAVSLDEEGWDVVRPFVNDMKLNFPVLLGNDQIADEFGGVAALPTTFILDKEGRIAKRHTGLVSKSDYADVIEELL